MGCRIRRAVVVLLMMVSQLVLAGLDEGLAAAKRKDFHMAFMEFDLLAEQGNPEAQSNLGDLYYYGNGVAQNYGKAEFWYRKAAEQGDAVAQNQLGVMYNFGKGVAQDYGKAVFWYRKAAEHGNAKAQSNLGAMYKEGFGVAQDYRKALFWYAKSAKQGDASAQNNIGVMYINGEYVPQDYDRGISWYRKAAEQGNANAQCNLGGVYAKGIGVPPDYVAAYALLNLATSFDSSLDKCISFRNFLLNNMEPEEVQAGQALTLEMSINGNMIKALDYYLAHPLAGYAQSWRRIKWKIKQH